MKIRTRLTIQFTTIFAFILLLFCLTVYFYTALTRRHSFYQELANRANIVAHVYLDADQVDKASYRRTLRKFYQTLPREIVQVYDWTGKMVFREGQGRLGVPESRLQAIRQLHRLEWKEGPRQYTGIVYQDLKGQFLVVASSEDIITLEKLDDLRLILITGFLGSLLVVVLAGWAFAKQALQPILKVVKEVEKISASDLHLRLSQADGADEVSHLALTFNNMLDRLETAFDMQNTFVSNASHELRTPLTAMIGELEVALMKPRENAEYRRVLGSILDEATLLAKLSNGMLQIAHASFDISKIKLVPIRFDELVFQASAEARKRQPGSVIDLHFDQLPEDENRLVCKGNETLLLIALINVLENACKFSGGKKVTATIHLNPGAIVLQVQDQGRGMQAKDLKNVFVPFWRADNVRDISGHGIGLPLAEKIIKVHRGSIRIESELHVGTKVNISIPTYHEILISF
ncbi:MAG: sensor histidine kinase [Adhaeribacter sp.]